MKKIFYYFQTYYLLINSLFELCKIKICHEIYCQDKLKNLMLLIFLAHSNKKWFLKKVLLLLIYLSVIFTYNIYVS